MPPTAGPPPPPTAGQPATRSGSRSEMLGHGRSNDQVPALLDNPGPRRGHPHPGPRVGPGPGNPAGDPGRGRSRGAVLAAVHHAEVVAHRVGEPFGSLVLAVAVTVIEVALIVTLMVSGGQGHRVAGPRHGLRRRDDHLQRHRRAVACSSAPCATAPSLFNAEGTGAALATVVDPGHAEPGAADASPPSAPGPEFSAAQLAFAARGLAGAVRHVRAHPDRPAPRLLPAGDHATASSLAARTSTPTPPTDRGRR